MFFGTCLVKWGLFRVSVAGDCPAFLTSGRPKALQSRATNSGDNLHLKLRIAHLDQALVEYSIIVVYLHLLHWISFLNASWKPDSITDDPYYAAH